MSTVVYTPVTHAAELQGILQLQRRNLPVNISAVEAAEQGFVTVVHRLEDLEELNAIAPHFIGKHGDTVVAYLLAMTAVSKQSIPVLVPMFDLFERITLHGKALAAYKYIVVGQVCVDKDYRGQGLPDACYAAYRDFYKPQYAFAITEIAVRNSRSIRVHARVGFKEVHQYAAPDGELWSIVVWEW